MSFNQRAIRGNCPAHIQPNAFKTFFPVVPPSKSPSQGTESHVRYTTALSFREHREKEMFQPRQQCCQTALRSLLHFLPCLATAVQWQKGFIPSNKAPATEKGASLSATEKTSLSPCRPPLFLVWSSSDGSEKQTLPLSDTCQMEKRKGQILGG